MLSNGIQTIILDDSIMRIAILIRKTLKKANFSMSINKSTLLKSRENAIMSTIGLRK